MLMRRGGGVLPGVVNSETAHNMTEPMTLSNKDMDNLIIQNRSLMQSVLSRNDGRFSVPDCHSDQVPMDVVTHTRSRHDILDDNSNWEYFVESCDSVEKEDVTYFDKLIKQAITLKSRDGTV